MNAALWQGDERCTRAVKRKEGCQRRTSICETGPFLLECLRQSSAHWGQPSSNPQQQLPNTSAHLPAVSPACTRSADAIFQPHAAALRRPLALQPAHSPCSLIVVPPCSCSALSFLCLPYCSLPGPPFLHRRLSAPLFLHSSFPPPSPFSPPFPAPQARIILASVLLRTLPSKKSFPKCSA